MDCGNILAFILKIFRGYLQLCNFTILLTYFGKYQLCFRNTFLGKSGLRQLKTNIQTFNKNQGHALF